MSPTSISGGGKLLTGGELISPASLKHQEEDLSSTNLEQRCYNSISDSDYQQLLNENYFQNRMRAPKTTRNSEAIEAS